MLINIEDVMDFSLKEFDEYYKSTVSRYRLFNIEEDIYAEAHSYRIKIVESKSFMDISNIGADYGYIFIIDNIKIRKIKKFRLWIDVPVFCRRIVLPYKALGAFNLNILGENRAVVVDCENIGSISVKGDVNVRCNGNAICERCSINILDKSSLNNKGFRYMEIPVAYNCKVSCGKLDIINKIDHDEDRNKPVCKEIARMVGSSKAYIIKIENGILTLITEEGEYKSLKIDTDVAKYLMKMAGK